MTIRAYLRNSVSHRALNVAMPRMTARELADTMARAYGGLHLAHLDPKTARPH